MQNSPRLLHSALCLLLPLTALLDALRAVMLEGESLATQVPRLGILAGWVMAIFVGRWLNQRMRGDHFLRYVHASVVAIGIVLLIQALRHR